MMRLHSNHFYCQSISRLKLLSPLKFINKDKICNKKNVLKYILHIQFYYDDQNILEEP